MAQINHDQWLKRLDQIEKKLDEGFERLASNPVFLGTVAVLMNVDSHRKILIKESMNRIWKSLQLPNRRDQERELHLLHEIQHRLLELEDRVRKVEKTEKTVKAEVKRTRKTVATPASATSHGGAISEGENAPREGLDSSANNPVDNAIGDSGRGKSTKTLTVQ